MIYDDEAKDYKVKIAQANLHVRKVTVTENVYTANQTTSTKMPAICRYSEIIAKTFLTSTGSSTWIHEHVFNREPLRRSAIVMNTNQASLGSKHANFFYFQKFNLSSITVYRNGYPIGGTPLATENDIKFIWIP